MPVEGYGQVEFSPAATRYHEATGDLLERFARTHNRGSSDTAPLPRSIGCFFGRVAAAMDEHGALDAHHLTAVLKLKSWDVEAQHMTAFLDEIERVCGSTGSYLDAAGLDPTWRYRPRVRKRR